MSSKEHVERMSRAISGTGFGETVSATFGENRIAILCRIPRENEAKWVELITKILVGAERSKKEAIPWQCHICRHYFLKVVNKEYKLVWGWNFSVQSNDMSTALDSIIRLVKGQPLEVNPNELTEFPLIGAPANRNSPKKGKGVYTIGGSQDFYVETDK
jgi:hypothetical protein